MEGFIVNREHNTIKELFTLSIRVSEKIESKNLHIFLRTSILNSDIITSKNSFYYFYYNSNTTTYEIIVFKRDIDKFLPEPFLLAENYLVKDNTIRVFLRDEYFLITQNHKLLIVKKVNKIEKEELSLYIKQVYKIRKFDIVDDVIDLSNFQPKNTTQSKQLFLLYPKKSFYYFCLFSISVLLLLCISIYLEKNKYNDVVIKRPIIQKHIVKLDNPSIVPFVTELFTYIKSKNIRIQQVYYINNQFKTTLMHSNKSSLLEFVNEFNKNISLKYFKYDEVKDIYMLDVSLEY